MPRKKKAEATADAPADGGAAAAPAGAAAAADDTKRAPEPAAAPPAAAPAAAPAAEPAAAPAADAAAEAPDVAAAAKALALAEKADAKAKAKEKEVDGDGFTRVSDGVWKKTLRPGSGPVPPVLHRVYAHVQGRLRDAEGPVILDALSEEYEFMLGQAQVATGLEMAVAHMHTGERALIKCGPKQGWSSTRRPQNVPLGTPLWFDVSVERFEKEKNLHEMSTAEKLAFAESRRDIARRLFEQNKPQSAFRQYEKANTALSGISAQELTDAVVTKAAQLQRVNNANCSACKLKTKEYVDCIVYCNKVLAAEPDNLKCTFRRATAYLERADWDDALRDLTRARELCVRALAAAPAVAAVALPADGKADSAAPDRKSLQQTLSAIDTRLTRARAGKEALTKAERKKYRGFFDTNAPGLYDDKPDVSEEAKAAVAARASVFAPVWSALGAAWSGVKYVFCCGSNKPKAAQKSA